MRSELVVEICKLINRLILKGTDVTFCWVPSHCGLFYNDKADIAAKQGSKKLPFVTELQVPFSIHECYSIITKTAWKKFSQNNHEIKNTFLPFKILDICAFVCSHNQNVYQARQIITLMSRWKLNAFTTKFKSNITCICGQHISPNHLTKCNAVRPFLPILDQHPFSEINKKIPC